MGTLWYGGTIYTMADEHEKVEAVFTEDGIIEMIGERDTLEEKNRGRISNKVNLNGGVLFPGFVDSHLHIIGHGEKLLRLDLSNLQSSSEISREIAKRVSQAPKDQWVIGEGWNENNLPDRKIFHRKELDELAPHHPLLLTRVCRHAVIANTNALKLAGITEKTEDPPGGIIVRDNDGHPTGLLLDQAQDLVKNVIPEVTEEFLENALSVSVKDMVKNGLVGGHSEDLNYYGGFTRTFSAFEKVINNENLKIKAHLLVHHGAIDEMVKHGLGYRDGTNLIELGPMKIFADGALGGRTALLKQPYNDAPETSGVAIHSSKELMMLVRKARELEMPVAIHVIGDLAMDYALNALEQYPPKLNQRDRLIHAQVLDKELLERLTKLPVVLDIQPSFVASDFPWVIERLGEERMKFSYAWKTIMNHGIHCAGGSDAPIEDINPLVGIHAAVTRKSSINEANNVYYPSEKLTTFEAIQLYTYGSAYAIGREKERGIIAPGYTADFTILDRDLFQISADEILQAKVEMTVVDETIVYKREERE